MLKSRFFAIESIVHFWPRTLTSMIAERFRSEGCSVAIFNFPNLASPNSFMVQRTLGEGEDIDRTPKSIALAYANERLNNARKIRELLERRTIILVSGTHVSTLMHQGGKVLPEKREDFFRFVEAYEKQYEIPKPDVTFLLDVPCPNSTVLENVVFCNSREKCFDKDEDNPTHILRSIESINQYDGLCPGRLYKVNAVENGMLYQLHCLGDSLFRLIKERL